MRYQTISQAYEQARTTEALFYFEAPRRIYRRLVGKFNPHGDLTAIVDGALIHASAKRCSPCLPGISGFSTPMVRGTITVSGLSQRARDALVDKIRDYLHNYKVSFSYEHVLASQQPDQKISDTTLPVSD